MTAGQRLSSAETDETGIFSQAHGRHDEVAFAAGDETYRWTDVVLFAMRSGDWAELEAETREGLACEEQAAATDGGPELADVYSAAEAFCRARGLVTVEQLMDWLERSGLTVESWLGCVKRAVLRRRSASEPPGPADRYAIRARAVAEVIWAEAVCSGILGRSARKLAERAAVAAALRGAGGANEEGEWTDDSASIVGKLRAQGVGGWALIDCRYRLKRLAALDRQFGRLPSHVVADALIRDVMQSPLPDSILFGDGQVDPSVCLQVAMTVLGTPTARSEQSLAVGELVHRHVRWHGQL